MTVLTSTTALDLIKQALKAAGVLGVGQTPLAEDANDALTQLNWMIAQWQVKRWLVYRLESLSVTSTGAQSYTVGPGGDIDVPSRPDRLEAAFFRQLVQSQPNQIDYPLRLLQSREDYNNIALKNLQSFPTYIFYDSDFPLGRIYPWPIPQPDIYQVFISIKVQLNAFPALTTEIDLPAEYYAALFYNLAVRLAPLYKQPQDATNVALAKESLDVIRGANAQIAQLQMPSDLVRPGIYNIFSDQIR